MKIDYYIKLVRARLADDNVVKSKDSSGNDVFFKSEIYTDEQIVSYLEGSLQRLNVLLPKGLSFEATPLEIFELTDLVVQGAVITALASKALLEKGREFSFLNGGIKYAPPNTSDILMRQWEVEMVDYRSKVEAVRSHFLHQFPGKV